MQRLFMQRYIAAPGRSLAFSLRWPQDGAATQFKKGAGSQALRS